MKKNNSLYIIWTGTSIGGIGSYIRAVFPMVKDKYEMKYLCVHSSLNMLKNIVVFLYAVLSIIITCISKKISKKKIIVHVNSAAKGEFFRSLLIMLLCKKVFNTQIILHEHSDEFFDFVNNLLKYWWGTFFVKLFYSFPDLIIFVSYNCQSKFLKLKKLLKNENILHRVVYNGIDLSENDYTFNLDDKDNNIVFMGRLSKEKNVSFILEVMRMMVDRKINLYLYIIGDGQEIDSLKKYCSFLKINEKVKFTGWLSKGEMAIILRKSKIKLLPSIYESFGLVILEAYSFGLVSLSSGVGGIPEIVENGKTGFILANNPDLYVEKLLYLLNNNKVYSQMAQNSIEHVKKFDIKKTVKQLISIYDNL